MIVKTPGVMILKSHGLYSWKLASLPEAATEIDSLQNLDTGELLLRYRCPPEELSAFLKRCHSVPHTAIECPRERLSRTLDWWPVALAGDQIAGPDAETLNVWRCDREFRYASGDARTVTAFLVATDEYVFYWEL